MTVREGMDSSRVREVASGLDTQVHRLGEILVRGRRGDGVGVEAVRVAYEAAVA